jgi:hypothetical protein
MPFCFEAHPNAFGGRGSKDRQLRMVRVKSKGFLKPLVRGLLGGALGGFVLVAILILIQFGTFGSGEWLVLSYLLFGLPCGAFIGIIVGAAILLINRQAGLNLRLFVRVILGMAIAVIFWILFFWGKEEFAFGDIRAWLWFCLTILLYAMATGGIAGVVIGRQTSSVLESEQEQRPFNNKRLDHDRFI